MTLTDNQLTGLRALQTYTRGTFDCWRMAGPANARQRQYVLTMLNDGVKVPRAQSGVTVIEARFFELMEATGTCKADQACNAGIKARELLS